MCYLHYNYATLRQNKSRNIANGGQTSNLPVNGIPSNDSISHTGPMDLKTLADVSSPFVSNMSQEWKFTVDAGFIG